MTDTLGNITQSYGFFLSRERSFTVGQNGSKNVVSDMHLFTGHLSTYSNVLFRGNEKEYRVK